ncbi:MAG: right-handed parallel beta-helix repeat-containing protein [Phycisphaerae bacterium]
MQYGSRRLTAPTVILVLACGWAWLQAGDLDPPPGPVVPTMKTLTEIEPRTPISSLPFTISLSGSYYLTGNLTGGSGENGITIAASDVTLDLNGFQLIGVPGSLSGIAVPEAQVNIAVRNGTIREWGGTGLEASLANNCQLERLRAFNNAGNGLHVDQGSTVVGCAARSNGLDGIIAGNASTIRGCAARNNGGDGVQAGSGSTVAYCTGRHNVDDGIQAGGGSTVIGCAATSNDDDGINVGVGSTVSACTATENGEDGIQADVGSTVRACTSGLNVDDGIQVTSGCHVVGNTCYSNGALNGAAGVRAIGADNRIDGNHVTNNSLGIDVDGEGNLIVRNSARENATNYDIVEGNKVGAITADPATAGPWSNFAF